MEKILSEELNRQLSLINYDRGKTLLEQSFINEVHDPIAEAIKWVTNNGFTEYNIGQNYNDCKSASQVFAKAALYGIKKLSDTQVQRVGMDNGGCLTVKVTDVDGSAPAPFTMKNFSVNDSLKNKLNKVIADLIMSGKAQGGNLSVGSVFFLQSFSFQWGKIVNDYKDAFKNNKDADSSKLFPDGWLNFFNHWYNTSNLSDALSTITNSEKFGCYEGKIINVTHGYNALEKNRADMLEIAHYLLPLGSFLITIASGGALAPILISAGLELTDAALYMYIDKDPYMAGLAAIFALVGPFDAFLKPLIKTVGTSILKKMALKTVEYTDEELEVIQYIARNGGKFTKLTKLGAGIQLTKYYLKSFSTSSKTIEFCVLLIKRLGLPVANFGLYAGAPFYAWDFMAAKLGLCNSSELKGLEKSKWKILQIIGYVGPYLQPFTEGCDAVVAEQKLDELEKSLLTMNGRIKTSIEHSLKSDFIYSTRLSKIYMLEVLYIQYLLKYLGYTEYTEEYSEGIDVWTKVKKPKYTIPPQNDIPGLTSYDPTGGIGAARRASQLPATGYKKDDNILAGELTKDKSFVKKTRKVVVTFKYGFYDENTKRLIESYQKDRGLTVDGVCGVNTLKRMLVSIDSIISSKKDIPNYNNVNLTPKEIEEIRKKTADEFEKLNKEYNSVSKEELKKELDKKVDELKKDINEQIEKIQFTDEDVAYIATIANEIENT